LAAFRGETFSQSYFVYYGVPWSTFINALRADAKTGNDNLADASLPGERVIHQHQTGQRKRPCGWVKHAAGDVRKRHSRERRAV